MHEWPSASISLVGGLARSQAKNKRVGCSVLNSIILILALVSSKTGSPPCPQALSIYEIKPPNAGHALPLWAMHRREPRSELADEYIVQAEQIESKENSATTDGCIPA
jgi:hypothetical protein